jgi:hypothetical protein
MSSLGVYAGYAKLATAHLWRRIKADGSYLLATGDTRSHVMKTFEGEPRLGAQVCIFVHYDQNGEVREHTQLYVQALADQGFSVVFVTNSGHLHDESVRQLQRCCSRILIRENRGYDFGAYRDGILSLGIELGKFSVLLIANDSVYGPITTLSTFFDRLDFGLADVWGATDSWQHRYHLQTYLIAFGPKVLSNPAFGEFWRSVRNVRSKDAAVRHYEIKMTQWFQAVGLRCRAVWDYQAMILSAQILALEESFDSNARPLALAIRQVAERALSAASDRTALNPTNELWLLLLWHGCPFIKRELLRRNPSRVPGLFMWHRIVSDRAPEFYQMIIDDLKRVASRIAP